MRNSSFIGKAENLLNELWIAARGNLDIKLSGMLYFNPDRVPQDYGTAYRGGVGLRQPLSNTVEAESVTEKRKALALEKIWDEFHGKEEDLHAPMSEQASAANKQLIDRCQSRLEVASALGDPKAQCRIGKRLMSDYRNDGPADYKKARPYFESATIKGDAEAAYHLAEMHLDGLGVDVDEAKGVALLELAAERKEPLAMLRLGQLYEAGQAGLEKDYSSAKRLYERTKQYTGQALYELEAIEHREYVERRSPETEASLKRAALIGSPEANYKLGMLHLSGVQVDKDHKKAISYLTAAVNRRHTDALNVMGQLYVAGRVVEQDIEKGLAHLKLSAKLDNLSAMGKLAELYESGEYMKPNARLARKYGKQLAAFKDITASSLIDVMPKSGDDVQHQAEEENKLSAFDAFYASSGYSDTAAQHTQQPEWAAQVRPSGVRLG